MNEAYEDMCKHIDILTKNKNKKLSCQEYKRAKTELNKILKKN